MKKTTYKIGVFGSDAGTSVLKANKTAKALGRALGNEKVLVVTGACSGLPYIAAHEAWALGSKVWGYSPEVSISAQHAFTPKDDLSIYTKLVFVPKNYVFVRKERVRKKYRNVTSTATCDAGIIISGRWGSLNEFTNLFDMGKVIGVLTKTGGMADEIPKLAKKVHKPGKAVVVYDSSPVRLVRKVLTELRKRS